MGVLISRWFSERRGRAVGVAFSGMGCGVIYGALNLGNGLGGAIGPWFGGVVHDVMGTYRVVFLASVGFCALGSTCFWLARRRAP